MAVFLQPQTAMKKFYFLPLTLITISLLLSCSANPSIIAANKAEKLQSILYFNPEVFPNIDEIKEPTYSAFYSAVSEKMPLYRNFKMLRVDSEIPFDDQDSTLISEFCMNNNAQFAIVPKVKYFKVGIGKYVFSNQVIVSMKLFDAAGNFLAEADYDTFKKNSRILGSAENSIKIGTSGAMKNIGKKLQMLQKNSNTNSKFL